MRIYKSTVPQQNRRNNFLNTTFYNRNKNYKIPSKKLTRYTFNLDTENCDIFLKDIQEKTEHYIC